MRSIGGFCALMVLGFGATAHAATSEYRLRQYPSASGNCHELAKSLGERITELSGVALSRAYCADISDVGYDMRFEYPAETDLRLVTTMDPSEGPSAQGGFYAKLEQCNAALPGETERFETATGLTAFVAYCQRDDLSSRPFAIHIDAFGSPEVKPRVEYIDLNGDPVGITAAQIEAQITAGVQQRDINTSYIKYEPFAGFGYVAMLYYNAQRLPLISRSSVRLQTQSECLAALANLKPIYDAQTPAPLVSFCSYRNGFRTYDITTLSLGQEVLPVYQSAERFTNRAACDSARPALVARYAAQGRYPIAASICSYDYSNRAWRVAMLEQR